MACIARAQEVEQQLLVSFAKADQERRGREQEERLFSITKAQEEGRLVSITKAQEECLVSITEALEEEQEERLVRITKAQEEECLVSITKAQQGGKEVGQTQPDQ